MLVIIICISVEQCDYIMGISVQCPTPGHKYYSISSDRGSLSFRKTKKLSADFFFYQDETRLRDHFDFF